MFLLILAGMAMGFCLRKRKTIIHLCEHATTVSIYVMLGLLGVSVGLNREVMTNLDTIGLQALILTVGAIGGSLICIVLAERYWARKS